VADFGWRNFGCEDELKQWGCVTVEVQVQPGPPNSYMDRAASAATHTQIHTQRDTVDTYTQSHYTNFEFNYNYYLSILILCGLVISRPVVT